VFCALSDEVDGGAVAGAGEGGVGPFASEGGWSTDHAGPGDGGALGAVGGEGVAVFEVVGYVLSIKRPRLAGVGLNDHRTGGRADRDDCCERAVLDVLLPVVLTGDDPVAAGIFVPTDDRGGGGDGSVLDEFDADGAVER
jgi:hypothetical protein